MVVRREYDGRKEALSPADLLKAYKEGVRDFRGKIINGDLSYSEDRGLTLQRFTVHAADLRYSSWTNGIVRMVDFVNCQFDGAEFVNETINQCALIKIESNVVTFDNVFVQNSVLDMVQLTHPQIVCKKGKQGLFFSDVSIHELTIGDADITHFEFLNPYMKNVGYKSIKFIGRTEATQWQIDRINSMGIHAPDLVRKASGDTRLPFKEDVPDCCE